MLQDLLKSADFRLTD